MYQVAVVANTTRELKDAVARAKGFIDYGIVDCIDEPDYVKATNEYYGCKIQTLAIYPIHCTKGEDSSYFAIVTRVTGSKWVNDDFAQVLFVGDEYEAMMDDDVMRRVVNFYARQPSYQLNRGDLEQLMASVLGPIFNIVPPTGLNETYTVSQLTKPGEILAYNARGASTTCLAVRTAACGRLPEVQDIYNLVEKAELNEKKE